MHRTERSRYQEETQTTLQLGTLSMEPASRHLSSAYNFDENPAYLKVYRLREYMLNSYKRTNANILFKTEATDTSIFANKTIQ